MMLMRRKANFSKITNMNRKVFLSRFSMAAGTTVFMPSSLFSQAAPKAEPLPPDKVKAFVGAGHNDLTKVKSLLAEFPSLLYATWDWGGGDFETAIEGAGHVGTKEVANFLIEAGARTNLFVLAMLGKTQLVKSWLETYPGYINAKGPHGFSLLHQAQRGGEDAKELVDYLQSKGLKTTKFNIS